MFYIFKDNIGGVKAESETAYLPNLTENLDLNPDLGDFKTNTVFLFTTLLPSKLSSDCKYIFFNPSVLSID